MGGLFPKDTKVKLKHHGCNIRNPMDSSFATLVTSYATSSSNTATQLMCACSSCEDMRTHLTSLSLCTRVSATPVTQQGKCLWVSHLPYVVCAPRSRIVPELNYSEQLEGSWQETCCVVCNLTFLAPLQASNKCPRCYLARKMPTFEWRTSCVVPYNAPFVAKCTACDSCVVCRRGAFKVDSAISRCGNHVSDTQVAILCELKSIYEEDMSGVLLTAPSHAKPNRLIAPLCTQDRQLISLYSNRRRIVFIFVDTVSKYTKYIEDYCNAEGIRCVKISCTVDHAVNRDDLLMTLYRAHALPPHLAKKMQVGVVYLSLTAD